MSSSTLADYQTRILAMLGDSLGSRYTPAQVDEAIRSALMEYSAANPVIQTTAFTVTTSGRVQLISGCENVQFLTRVQWPANTDPNLNRVFAWFAFYPGGVPELHFHWDTPQAGDVIHLDYAANHTLNGLDSATLTTIPPVHDSLIGLGAAAHAAIARSTQISEQMTQRASNSTLLAEWGSNRLAEYRSALGLLAVAKHSLFQPPKGWPLDLWDRQNEPNPKTI